jgi:hypothetical protein
MKKHILFFLVMIFGLGVVFAQDEEEQKPKKKKDRPVSEMFSSGIIIDEQTCVIPAKKTLEMQIMHRFGVIKDNGASDLWGVYAPSANTRMGLNYSIRDNLSVGYGITRLKMQSDFSVKWNILRQTRKNTMPIDVTLYANMAIDGRNESVFKTSTADSAYKFTNRLSYFTQIMVSRKFTDWFSFSVNGSFTHYNAVPADTAGVKGMNHDKFGIGFMGAFKFSPQSSIVIHYTIPLNINGMKENTTVTNISKYNFGIGYQVATATHAFEVFITASNGIIPQETYMWNNSDFFDGEIRIGFNITRLWGF